MEKQLQLRLTTAAALIALLVTALYFGGVLLLGLVGIVYIVINWEFYSLHKGTNAWYKKLILMFLGLCVGFLSVLLGLLLKSSLVFATLLCAVVLCSYFVRHRKVVILAENKGSVEHAILGLFYVGFLGSLMLLPVLWAGGTLVSFIWWFAVVIFTDTFAYFGGKKFGKHKLAPAISPGKTVEGAVFGLLGAVIASLVVCWFMFAFGRDFESCSVGPIIVTPRLCVHFHHLEDDSIREFVIFGLITGVLAILGDLFESLVKRVNGVKDSSNILPGHGGLLDRLDAFLFTVPVLLWAQLFFFG